MTPLCWMRSAFVLVAHLAFAEGVVTCSSRDLQRMLGDYSAICSGFFSDAFTLTSELGNYVHLLNLTAVQLSTAVRSIQQVLLMFSYWNIIIYISISNIFLFQLTLRCSDLDSYSLPNTQVPELSDQTSSLLGSGFFVAFSWTNVACAITTVLLFLSLLVVCFCAGRSRRLSDCMSLQVIINWIPVSTKYQ